MASKLKAEPNESIPYKQLNQRRDQVGGNALEPLHESAHCASAQAMTCAVAYGGGWERNMWRSHAGEKEARG
jgi:hypothetical protein